MKKNLENKIKIFISHSRIDREKAQFLKDLIDDNIYEGIIVDKTVEELKDLADKVADNLFNSNAFIVLLTLNSYNNVWVNQELGFAYLKFKTNKKKGFYHLIRNEVLNKLSKGFIHNHRDCNIYFDDEHFKIKATELVEKFKKEFKSPEKNIIAYG